MIFLSRKGTPTKPLYANKDSKLAIVRKSRGLSQQKLSDLSGVSMSMIGHIEQKIKPVESLSFARFCKLLNALSCKPIDLVEDETTLKIVENNF